MPAFRRLLFKLLLSSCALLAPLALPIAATAQSSETDAALDGIRQQVDAAQQSVKRAAAASSAAGTGDAGDLGLADDELQNLRSNAAAARTKAADLADKLAPQLAGVQARVAELGTPQPGTKEDADVASQRAALTKERNDLDSQLKLARLLAVESEQLSAQLGSLRRSQFQARLGERTSSILASRFWSELADDYPRDAQRVVALTGDVARAARAAPLSVWLLAPFALAAAWWLLRWLQKRMLRWLTTRAPAGRLRRSLHAAIETLRWTANFGAAATLLYALLSWSRSLPPAAEGLLAEFCGMLWFGGYMYGLTKALTCADKPSWRLPPLPDSVAASQRWFPLQITVASLATWLAERLAVRVNASLSLTVAVNCIVALVLGLTLVRGLIRTERRWRREFAAERGHTRPLPLAIFAALNWLVLTTAVVCLLVGYVAFGSFAVKQVVWGAVVVGTAYLLAALVDDLLMAWLAGEPHEAGAGSGVATPGGRRPAAQVAVLASGVLRLALLLLALLLLLAPFGEGPADLLRRGGQWQQQALAVGEFKLQPAALLQALLVLLLGLTAVRLLRRWLSDRYLPTTALDPGMRASATSLFGYAGVVVAVSLALSAMGIGLERIAWVASALSVGIGFGLQAVVQNFVSGLILLAERPVKVGDWVSLGGVEGDIRRINVRATEIQMGDRSTVIVPNSEFITKVVRNVTMAEPLGLVQIKLPVPLAADAEQVRTLMFEAYQAHGDVLAAPAPNVLLDGVDGANLLFNATGFVSSPRAVAGVRSTLLFDVLKRLHDAKITLGVAPTTVLLRPDPNLPPSSAAGPPTPTPPAAPPSGPSAG
jgi:potassium efflux system protein